MNKYKGYGFVRRYDRTQARWLIVEADGWTVDRANSIKDAKAKVDEILRGGLNGHKRTKIKDETHTARTSL